MVLITAEIGIPNATRFWSPVVAGQTELSPKILYPPEVRPALQLLADPLPMILPARMLFENEAKPASLKAPPPEPDALLSSSASFSGIVL